MFYNIDTNLKSTTLDSDNQDPSEVIKNINLSNVNRRIMGQLNVNGLKNKIDPIRLLAEGNIDVLVITESKLDQSFPSQQFAIDGFSLSYRCDRNGKGEGVIIDVTEMPKGEG